MALTDEQRLVYQRRLLDAEEKKHLLVTGRSVEQFIDQNGESVKYTKANLGLLERYIGELTDLLNPADALAKYPRPMRFLF